MIKTHVLKSDDGFRFLHFTPAQHVPTVQIKLVYADGTSGKTRDQSTTKARKTWTDYVENHEYTPIRGNENES